MYPLNSSVLCCECWQNIGIGAITKWHTEDMGDERGGDVRERGVIHSGHEWRMDWRGRRREIRRVLPSLPPSWIEPVASSQVMLKIMKIIIITNEVLVLIMHCYLILLVYSVARYKIKSIELD